MTRLAVMQPYLFPYLGYWQLLHAVDRHVVYDDVNYIKGGWINRNRLLVAGQVAYVTVPLHGASSFSRICDIALDTRAPWRDKLLRTIAFNYRRAPAFAQVFPVLERLVQHEAALLADYLLHQIRGVAAWLGIGAEIVPSSRVYDNAHLRGQERVLDICRREGARTYVNLPGGRALYDAAAFGAAGVALRFVQPQPLQYPQTMPGFAPGLSIIDTLMALGVDGTRRALDDCDLAPA